MPQKRLYQWAVIHTVITVVGKHVKTNVLVVKDPALVDVTEPVLVIVIRVVIKDARILAEEPVKALVRVVVVIIAVVIAKTPPAISTNNNP